MYLVETVRKNVSVDWTVREPVGAKLRVMVKRLLWKYGCPPDMKEKTTKTDLEQAEVLGGEWAENILSLCRFIRRLSEQFSLIKGFRLGIAREV